MTSLRSSFFRERGVDEARPLFFCGPMSAVGPWSNSDAVSYRSLRWCSDRLAVHQQIVLGDIDEVLLAETPFGVDARGHWLSKAEVTRPQNQVR